MTRKLYLLLFAGLTILLAAMLFAANASAQTNAKKKPKNRLPRVGAIKDYPATGLATGCGNLYVILPKDAQIIAADYVFLARPGGADAWMNLDGRDVNLRQIKPARRQNKTSSRFYYRWRKIFIIVLIRDFKSRNKIEKSDDFMFEMIITLRKGKKRRAFRAIGSSDC